MKLLHKARFWWAICKTLFSVARYGVNSPKVNQHLVRSFISNQFNANALTQKIAPEFENIHDNVTHRSNILFANSLNDTVLQRTFLDNTEKEAQALKQILDSGVDPNAIPEEQREAFRTIRDDIKATLIEMGVDASTFEELDKMIEKDREAVLSGGGEALRIAMRLEADAFERIVQSVKEGNINLETELGKLNDIEGNREELARIMNEIKTKGIGAYELLSDPEELFKNMKTDSHGPKIIDVEHVREIRDAMRSGSASTASLLKMMQNDRAVHSEKLPLSDAKRNSAADVAATDQ